MKTRNLTVLITAILFSLTATAGQVNTERVTVTPNADGSGTAAGTLSAARFSRNTVEFIGCGFRMFNNTTGGLTRWGFCQANNSAGTHVICMIEDSDLLNAIATISDYSFVNFNWNAAGTCTRIGISTQSFYIP